MMELHILPPLVVFEVNALLGVFALSRSRGDSQHRYFAGFALAAGLWCLGSMLYFLMPKEFREVGLRLGFVGVTIIPAIYVALCHYHSGRPLSGRDLVGMVLAVIFMNPVAKKGIIDPKDVAFFLSLAGFCLYLNVLVLER